MAFSSLSTSSGTTWDDVSPSASTEASSAFVSDDAGRNASGFRGGTSYAARAPPPAASASVLPSGAINSDAGVDPAGVGAAHRGVKRVEDASNVYKRAASAHAAATIIAGVASRGGGWPAAAAMSNRGTS